MTTYITDSERETMVQVFLADSEESLNSMEQSALALESNPSDEESLQAIFRAAHTVKGNASCLGFTATTELAHALEDVLARLRSRELTYTTEIATVILGAVDLLRDAVARSARGEQIDPATHASIKAELARAAAAGGHDATAHTPPVPRSARDDTRRRMLRIDLEKLDTMLDLVGEISIARSHIAQMLESGEPVESFAEAHREADRLHVELQELVTRVRMVPVGLTFAPFHRTVRDLCLSSGKQARLVISGEEVEIDATVVEKLRDPLVHMIRNALDHGIELPEERKAAGKDPMGVLALSASHDAGNVVITLSDDGRGLDQQRILKTAIERGLIEEGQRLSEHEIARLIFAPGFSTARAVTDISGRGIGMDVVQKNIESLRGSVSVESRPGAGTCLTLRLPLTLAMITGLSVKAGDETYIIPLESVVECVAMESHDRPDAQYGIFSLRGTAIPFIRLRSLFGVSAPAFSPREYLVMVRSRERTVALAVDSLIGESQTVIKSMGNVFHNLPAICGSAILGNGRVALILDVPAILAELTRGEAEGAAHAQHPQR